LALSEVPDLDVLDVFELASDFEPLERPVELVCEPLEVVPVWELVPVREFAPVWELLVPV